MIDAEVITKHANRLYSWDKNSEWDVAVRDINNGLYTEEEVIGYMINEYTEKMYIRDTKPIYKKVEAEAKRLRLCVYFQTDPRGATIYLSKDPIPENNYTIASCIY